MKYPVAVWKSSEAEPLAYTAVVPDLPGVVTEVDAFEEIEAAVREAAAGWMEAEREAGSVIPEASSVEKYANEEDYARCTWLLVELDDEAPALRPVVEAVTDLEHLRSRLGS